ncbi:MAG: hypothetical protein ACI9BV_003785 [Rhodothermales bacterium]|jgi:hypothetical protein
MFVSERLVFLQLQKTGSTYTEGLLKKTLGGSQRGKHKRLPADAEPEFVLGSIRNPWDWYVSLWAFGCSGRGGAYNQATGRRLLRIKSVFGKYRKLIPGGNPIVTLPSHWLDPRCRWWEWAYGDPEDPERFRAWLKRLLDPEIEERIIPQFRRTGFIRVGGLLSFRYLWLFSRDNTLLERTNGVPADFDMDAYDRAESALSAVVRLEHLSSDLMAALREAGHDLTPEQELIIRAGTGVDRNASKRRATAKYYDDQTRELVANRERFIINRFGYTFPD